MEHLVGRPLHDGQQVYVVALDHAIEPAADERNLAWRELEAIIAETHSHVRQTSVPLDQLEQTIDEACDDVRYGRSP